MRHAVPLILVRSALDVEAEFRVELLLTESREKSARKRYRMSLSACENMVSSDPYDIRNTSATAVVRRSQSCASVSSCFRPARVSS
jgi:hypothetical protein